MAVSSSNILRKIEEASSWYLCAILLLSMILLSSSFQGNNNLYYDDPSSSSSTTTSEVSVRGHNYLRRQPYCDEIYVVREGETLHTISDKCGDPFIVEQNPHIHDPDDVFPGLVIKITPNSNRV